jgi:hypothetical protein
MHLLCCLATLDNCCLRCFWPPYHFHCLLYLYLFGLEEYVCYIAALSRLCFVPNADMHNVMEASQNLDVALEYTVVYRLGRKVVVWLSKTLDNAEIVNNITQCI